MAGGAAVNGAADDDDEGEISDINVTPLVDVMLVLLIIMMVAAPLLAQNQSIKVELPKAASGEETPKSPLLLLLKRDGTLHVGEQAVSEDEARAKVRAAKASDPELAAVIDADKGVSYGAVIRVIDLVKREGITSFALNIDTGP